MAAILLVLGFPGILPAAEPDIGLSQLRRRSWPSSEYAELHGLTSLAQTPDGYIWVGGAAGLHRFDGVRFSRIPLDPNVRKDSVRTLLASRNGALWVGANSKVYRVEANGGVREAGPPGVVSRIVERRDGSILLSYAVQPHGRLIRMAGDIQENFSWATELPGAPIQAMLEDSTGRLWLGTGDSLCQVDAAGHPQCIAMAGGCLGLLELDGHRIVVSGGRGTRIFSMEAPVRLLSTLVENTPSRAVARDSGGAIWIGTLGQGLIRMQPSEPAAARETTTRRQGLSGNLVEAILNDSNGNLWVLTTSGLDRFQEPAVPRLTAIEGLASEVVTALLPAANGDVWLGTIGTGAVRLKGGSWKPQERTVYPAPGTITTFLESPQKGIWIGSASHLYHADGEGKLAPVPASSDVGSILGAVEDGEGGLWAINGANRVLRLKKGDTKAVEPVAGLSPAYRLLRTHEGAIWIGHFNGGLSRIDGDRLTRVLGENPSLGPIQSMFEDPDGGVWIVQSNQISRLLNSTWTKWTSHEGLPDEPIYAAAAGAANIWILTATTIVDFGNWRHPEVRAPVIRHGMDLGPLYRATSPRFATGPDGRLWIASDDGVGRFTPRYSGSAAPSPQPLIESLVVDGVTHATNAGSTFEFLAHSLQIQFTALRARQPEDVLFQYMLKGVQKSWSSPARDRFANYSNLKPGLYTFCVALSGFDARTEPAAGACQEFRVLPMFHQTWWFFTLCALAAAGLMAAIYKYRLSQIRERYELILEERLRVARDLHDTVLQGFSGVTFHMEAASRLLDQDPQKCRAVLSNAVQQADQSLSEAREMVGYLRVSMLEGDFEGALRELGNQLFNEGTPEFHLQFRQDLGNLPKGIEKICYLATREAVRNAAQHASAHEVSVTVDRGTSGLEIIIKDDGTGFDRNAAKAKGRWGLNGMMERCASAGGKCIIQTARGAGTEVRITFPRQLL